MRAEYARDKKEMLPQYSPRAAILRCLSIRALSASEMDRGKDTERLRDRERKREGVAKEVA